MSSTVSARAPGRSALLCLLFLAGLASAEPWLDPGDTALRHDLTLLADAGIIGTPITQWPLSWGDVQPDETRLGRKLTAWETAALFRVRQRLREARRIDEWRPAAHLAAGTEGYVLRGFEDTPREQLEAGVGATWTGRRFALRLRGEYALDAEDGRDWRADGSYAGVALGNWMFAAAMTDRWWGPGWLGNMILTNNARPIPAITIDRNSTEPFESKWLRWIGHWDFVTLFGFLESGRAVPDAQFFGMRLTVKPARWLELGVSRTAMWCGEDRPCDLSTFFDLLVGKDNAGENVTPEDEPGNQLAGYDVRLTGAGLGIPVALYFQQIGEDEQDLQPALFMTQLGAEYWGGFDSGLSYRLYVEYSDTLCGGNLFGSGQPNTCYNHPIYEDGMRYRGRTIGHTADNDAKLLTLGGVVNESGGGRWSLTLTGGELNRVGQPDPRNSVTAVKADYIGANLVHRRALRLGQLQAGVGYESLDRVTTGRDDDFRVFLNWHAGW